MTRPGVVVTSRAEPPPRSAPTDVGMAFMVGATETGADVQEIHSFTEYQAEFGIRTGFVESFDAAECFFREGGAKLTVARVVAGVGGLAIDPADVPTGTSAEVLAWVGGDPDRARVALAVETGSATPRSTLVASLEAVAGGPVPQAAATTVQAALDRLTKDMGPGQVFAATASPEANHASLLAHAAANNRIALLDPDPASAAAALVTLGDGFKDDPTARYGAVFAPSVVVPGLTSADTRTVPASSIVAGIIARNDAAYTANVASAGVKGESRFGIDLTTRYTDAEREDLNDAGIDALRVMLGGVRVYGYRTLADMNSGWGSLSNARLNMEITAKAEEIGERYLFTQIDGRRVTISQFGADLTGMLLPYYDAGSLYGTTKSDAFYVDVGSSVNTDATIAAGELHAVLALRMSPFAEYVLIEIVKVATETPLSLAA